MAFVNVRLVYSGNHFTVDVDDEATYGELCTILVDLLAKEKLLDRNQKYEVALRGALRLEEGSTLEVLPATGLLRARNLKPA